MNLKSNVDINYNNTDDDNKSKFLETMKSIIKKDDADQLLNILTDRRWDINTTNISTNEEDKINPMEKQSHSSHILLKNEDKANLLHSLLICSAFIPMCFNKFRICYGKGIDLCAYQTILLLYLNSVHFTYASLRLTESSNHNQSMFTISHLVFADYK
ncbi:unnamed protein product [Trichobilharzia szidati]|nr:unnamed protein product [Trichobilharzia szidati]